MGIDVLLGQKIRVAIESAGLERGELATALKISEHDLAAMEAGTERVGAKTLYQISKRTKLNISWFFDTNISGDSSLDCVEGSNTQSEDDYPKILQNLRLNKTISNLCEAAKKADLLGLKTTKVA